MLRLPIYSILLCQSDFLGLRHPCEYNKILEKWEGRRDEKIDDVSRYDVEETIFRSRKNYYGMYYSYRENSFPEHSVKSRMLILEFILKLHKL
jgi:hypothetical protein